MTCKNQFLEVIGSNSCQTHAVRCYYVLLLKMGIITFTVCKLGQEFVFIIGLYVYFKRLKGTGNMAWIVVIILVATVVYINIISRTEISKESFRFLPKTKI
jgi:uncharacterized membrane protein YhaH (DUF805 family)